MTFLIAVIKPAHKARGGDSKRFKKKSSNKTIPGFARASLMLTGVNLGNFHSRATIISTEADRRSYAKDAFQELSIPMGAA